MSMKVSEIKRWLSALPDDAYVGIHEKGMSITLADELYETNSLEIGMALSSQHFTQKESTAESVDPWARERAWLATHPRHPR